MKSACIDSLKILLSRVQAKVKGWANVKVKEKSRGIENRINGDFLPFPFTLYPLTIPGGIYEF